MSYVATFYTHFGAMTFKRRLNTLGDETAELISAPRQVSVSCGTAVSFCMPFDERTMPDEDTEAIYLVKNDSYERIYHND